MYTYGKNKIMYISLGMKCDDNFEFKCEYTYKFKYDYKYKCEYKK